MMLFGTLLAAGLFSAFAEANVDSLLRPRYVDGGLDFPLIPRQNTCPPVHIIVARGSNEPAGTGAIGSVARDVARDNPGTTIEPVAYIATIANYSTSSYNGTLSVIDDLEATVKQCGTKTKIVLMGYSQGAHVIGDALCGGGGVSVGTPASPYNDPVPKNIADQVVAVIMMGDPRFVANLTFDRGTSLTNGIFARPDNLSCEAYADRIQSYCNKNDPFCSGGTNFTVHALYTVEFGQAARQFVDQKLGTTATNSSSGGSSGNSTGGSSPSGTGAPRPSGTGSGSSPSPSGQSNWAARVSSPVHIGATVAALLLLAALL